MDLIEIIDVNAVRVVSGASSKKRVLQDVAQAVHQVYGVDQGAALDALLEREKLGPTGVGRGVALPHARLECVDKIVGCFLKLEKPIDFDAVDRQPVDLVFALFAPVSGGVNHLKALATISRTLRDPGVCDKLRNNSEAGTIFEVLLEGPASIAA